MKRLNHILTLLLTVVFIYSATGQAIVSHYCNLQKVNTPKDACCNEDEGEENCCTESKSDAGFKSEESCCTIITSYQVNPFSVQKPQQKKEIRSEITFSELIQYLFKPVVLIHVNEDVNTCYNPPGRQILLEKSILII